MQNKEGILRQEGCWVASGLQGYANFITSVLLDTPKCTSVSWWQHTTSSYLLYPAPLIKAHPVILLITHLNYKVHAGGYPGFIFDELQEIKEDTGDFCLHFNSSLAVVFSTAARMSWCYLSEARYLWCLVPSRTAGDAVDTQETQLNHAMEQLPFSNYSYEAINQSLIGKRSIAKRHVLPQWNCLLECITS